MAFIKHVLAVTDMLTKLFIAVLSAVFEWFCCVTTSLLSWGSTLALYCCVWQGHVPTWRRTCPNMALSFRRCPSFQNMIKTIDIYIFIIHLYLFSKGVETVIRYIFKNMIRNVVRYICDPPVRSCWVQFCDSCLWKSCCWIT